MLQESSGLLARLREGTARAGRTLEALRGQLPPELATQVWGAVLEDGTLTALVRSGAWATRLRYAAPRLAPLLAAALDQPVERIRVKVRRAP